MMYFKYDVDDNVLFAGNNIVRKLDNKTAKQILTDMKGVKQTFRGLIDNFDRLSVEEKLRILNKFYKFDEVQFRVEEAKYYFRAKKASLKRIPVDLYYTTDHFNFVKANSLLVYADDKVKFGKKPLSAKELYKLQDKNKLFIIDATAEDNQVYTKAAVESTKTDKLFVKPLLYPEGRVTFNDFMLTVNNRPFANSVVDWLQNQAFKDNLLDDYTNLFVPMYKEALRRLDNMVEKSKTMEQKEVEAMRKAYFARRDKKNKNKTKYTKTSKVVIDQTKGR